MTTHTASNPSYLSDKEIAQRYSIGRATVWRWLKTQPTFPRPIKLAGCTRWRINDLTEWEKQQEEINSNTAAMASAA